MSRSLSPSVRRQIIAYDPASSDAVSVSEFCRSLGISRPSFYKVRDRFQTEGNAALNPRSRAPKRAAHVYDEDTAKIVLKVRTRLTGKGWDAGPKSIWHVCVDEALFASHIPSVSTIARVLSSAGVVDKNPRKRPRSSYIRFQRSAAMEMWQLDALEYKLFDAEAQNERTKIAIYQLLDDSTRFDVGTSVYAGFENGDDAVDMVTRAVEMYGVPQELLSDNGAAFNLSRQGAVTQLQRTLADRGCLSITGSFRSPTTQGKNERSHQTLCRFLNAHSPATLERVQELLIEYREHYNHRRHHQSLPGEMTPGQAWEAVEHRPSDCIPIPHSDLIAKALAYKDQALADAAKPGDGLTAEDPQHMASGRLRELPDEIVINRQNPQIYLHGKIIKVPIHLVGTYVPVLTDTEYTLFDVRDGAESIGFPFPLDTKQRAGRMILLWQVRGARIRDPKPGWLQKQREYEARHYPSQPTPNFDGSLL